MMFRRNLRTHQSSPSLSHVRRLRHPFCACTSLSVFLNSYGTASSVLALQQSASARGLNLHTFLPFSHSSQGLLRALLDHALVCLLAHLHRTHPRFPHTSQHSLHTLVPLAQIFHHLLHSQQQHKRSVLHPPLNNPSASPSPLPRTESIHSRTLLSASVLSTAVQSSFSPSVQEESLLFAQPTGCLPIGATSIKIRIRIRLTRRLRRWTSHRVLALALVLVFRHLRLRLPTRHFSFPRFKLLRSTSRESADLCVPPGTEGVARCWFFELADLTFSTD